MFFEYNSHINISRWFISCLTVSFSAGIRSLSLHYGLYPFLCPPLPWAVATVLWENLSGTSFFVWSNEDDRALKYPRYSSSVDCGWCHFRSAHTPLSRRLRVETPTEALLHCVSTMSPCRVAVGTSELMQVRFSRYPWPWMLLCPVHSCGWQILSFYTKSQS